MTAGRAALVVLAAYVAVALAYAEFFPLVGR